MRTHLDLGDRFRASILIALCVVTACDTVAIVSASHQTSRTPDSACVIDVLRSMEDVTTAGPTENAVAFAHLRVPGGIEAPSATTRLVVEQHQDGESTRLRTYVAWIDRAQRGRWRAYEDYIQKRVDEFDSQLAERCP